MFEIGDKKHPENEKNAIEHDIANEVFSRKYSVFHLNWTCVDNI